MQKCGNPGAPSIWWRTASKSMAPSGASVVGVIPQLQAATARPALTAIKAADAVMTHSGRRATPPSSAGAD